MKIAVIGTHCTGKTTLCHDIVAVLRHAGKDAQVVNEVARSCPFQVNDNATFEAQYWILATQIKNELEYGDLHDVIVCDRGIIDNYMYLLRKFPEKADILTPFVLHHCKTYDLIIKTTIEKEPEADGFRSTTEKFREEIDTMLRTFLDAHGVPHIIVTGNDKVAMVLSLLEARA